MGADRLLHPTWLNSETFGIIHHGRTFLPLLVVSRRQMHTASFASKYVDLSTKNNADNNTIQLYLSLIGKMRMNLQAATYRMAEKFKIRGPGLNLSIEHQVHIALLVSWVIHVRWNNFLIYMPPIKRCFIMENMWRDWVARENDDASSDDDALQQVEHISKKHKGVRKVGKGEDFWSKAQKWLGQKRNQWGSDMNAPQWQRWAASPGKQYYSSLYIFPSYIHETLAIDNEKYPHMEPWIGPNPLSIAGIVTMGSDTNTTSPSNLRERSFNRSVERRSATNAGILARLM